MKDVEVLAARAYSMMSPSEFMELRVIVNQPMMMGSFTQNFERIKHLAHVFDVEHAKSVPLLNGLVGQLPVQSSRSGRGRKMSSQGTLCREPKRGGRNLRN